jgi:hypothetical protein
MLGQPSQIFAEAEFAYRRDRLFAEFPKRTTRRHLHLPARLFGGSHRPNGQVRRPRHVMPAPHHLTARI